MLWDFDINSQTPKIEASAEESKKELEQSHSLTPLHIATLMGKKEMVKYLTEYKKTDLNIKNSEGDTALHYVADDGSAKITDIIASKMDNLDTKIIWMKKLLILHMKALWEMLYTAQKIKNI